MDVERQKLRVSNILKEIDLLSRHDRRNACIKARMEKKLHSAKLMEAGDYFTPRKPVIYANETTGSRQWNR